MLGLILGSWRRVAVYAALAFLILSLAELDGYRRGEKKLYEYQAQQATAAVAIVVKREAATERVVTKYVKVAAKTQTVTNTIEKEIVRYVETNPGYCLDRQWGRLHDAAALDAIPDSPSVTDGTGGVPTAAAAIQTVAGNYGACIRNAEKLTALQEWVREQEGVK